MKTNSSINEDQKQIDSLISLIVKPDSWLDSVFKYHNVRFQPRYPDLFINYSTEKADSIISLCEQLTYELYGPRDSIAGKCELKKIEKLPEVFDFLSVIWSRDHNLRIGYGITICNNPLPAIEWYRRNRQHITSLGYRYLEFINSIMDTAPIASSPVDIGLKYNDRNNRIWAQRIKREELVVGIERLIENCAPDSIISDSISQILYCNPFFDIKAFDVEHDFTESY